MKLKIFNGFGLSMLITTLMKQNLTFVLTGIYRCAQNPVIQALEGIERYEQTIDSRNN